MTQEISEAARRGWMGLLATAPEARIAALLGALDNLPSHAWLRAPETGGVMVRGRTGGSGAPFNLGEMTVTRCALRLEAQPGEVQAQAVVGHGYVQGRSKAKAEMAARVDALMQTSRAAEIEAQVLVPLRAERDAQKRARAAKAAATKVDFFTLVRGED